MSIAVLGSTDGTGLALLQQAIQRRHEVFAFARDPQKILISDPHLKVIQGDVLDLTLSNSPLTARTQSYQSSA